VLLFSCACLYPQGIYTPSKIDGGHVIIYENRLTNTTGGLLRSFNTSLLSFEDASQAGALTRLPPRQWEALNSTVASLARVNNRTISTRGNTASECHCQISPWFQSCVAVCTSEC
jgi:hypothetical protein